MCIRDSFSGGSLGLSGGYPETLRDLRKLSGALWRLSGALQSSPETLWRSPRLSGALQSSQELSAGLRSPLEVSGALWSSPGHSKAPQRSGQVIANRLWLWLKPACDCNGDTSQ
eukprot:13149615-Alexandrium_andersonii.AAC.1